MNGYQGPYLHVQSVHIFFYHNVNHISTQCMLRSLERQLSSKLIRLAECMPDVSEPNASESARVQTILKEPEDAGYWFHASKDGGRENHYRGMHLIVDPVRETWCLLRSLIWLFMLDTLM